MSDGRRGSYRVLAPEGKPEAPIPAQPVAAPAPVPAPSAREAHNKLLERRCVVCHGCYDAPCQLVMSGAGGLARGASKVKVYDGARLFAVPPTRLGVDATSIAGWRDKDFHPVLPEGDAADPAASVLVRMLELKRKFPLPVSERLPDDLEVGIDRAQQCARVDEFDALASEHPLRGMPYALPALSGDEHALLLRWVEAGAREPEPAALTPRERRAIQQWETFLNGTSNKERLMARYLYEHLFLASLHFDEGHGAGRYFRLVHAGAAAGCRSTRSPHDVHSTTPATSRSRTASCRATAACCRRRTCLTCSTTRASGAGAACSSTLTIGSTRCHRTRPRRRPIRLLPSGSCLCDRATASCSKKPSSP